jgi:LEA14-like dessication related protein
MLRRLANAVAPQVAAPCDIMHPIRSGMAGERSQEIPMKIRLATLPLLALFLGTACASLSGKDIVEPEVHLVNLVPVEATLFEQKIRIDLRILNPNDFDLPLDGLTFDLRLNGQKIARGQSADSVKIPRLGEGTIQVMTHTNSIAIVRQFVDAPRDGKFEYEINGDVFIKNWGRRKIPFDHSGVIELGPINP